MLNPCWAHSQPNTLVEALAGPLGSFPYLKSPRARRSPHQTAWLTPHLPPCRTQRNAETRARARAAAPSDPSEQGRHRRLQWRGHSNGTAACGNATGDPGSPRSATPSCTQPVLLGLDRTDSWREWLTMAAGVLILGFSMCAQEDKDLAGHLRDGRGRGARLRRGGAHHVRPARAHQLPRGRRRRRRRAAAAASRVVVPLPRARRQAPPLQPRVRAGGARQGRRCLGRSRLGARRAPAHRGDACRQCRHGRNRPLSAAAVVVVVGRRLERRVS